MKQLQVGTCVYCGKQAKLTDEHMVPRCLFPESLPSTVRMITVKTCVPCNGGKSQDDTYLRDYLLSDMATRRNLVAQKLRQGKLMRSVRKNRSEIARAVIKKARPKAIYSPGGIYLGSPFAAPVEAKRLESSFAAMVRGLYFHVHKTILPQDVEITVARIDRFQGQSTWDESIKQGAAVNWIQQDVFPCSYVADRANPLFSRWLLLFYNAILIEVITMPADWANVITSESYIQQISKSANTELLT